MVTGALKWWCYLCDDHNLNPELDGRAHRCDSIMKSIPRQERHCYVSIIPDRPDRGRDPSDAKYWEALPEKHDYDADLFAREAHSPNQTTRLSPKARDELQSVLPYKSDLLRINYQLRCGNPHVRSYPPFEGLTAFKEIMVCDMATYGWSSTLKDPRSWAILNNALDEDNNIYHLAVWTAGNAALSLAQIAYNINAASEHGPVLQVHAIVNTSLASEIQNTLRLWQCTVINYDDTPDQKQSILDPKQIRRQVADKVRKEGGPAVDDSNYWHVTDGWDGVGLQMYRLLGAQLVREFNPGYILAPLGTGDLVVGLQLGIQDVEQDRNKGGYCRLIGVVPKGNKSCLPCVALDGKSLPNIHDGSPGDEDTPDLPKLECAYTPLAPILHTMLQRNELDVIQVGPSALKRAAERVLIQGVRGVSACEASALACFGGLDKLQDLAASLEGARLAQAVLVGSLGYGR